MRSGRLSEVPATVRGLSTTANVALQFVAVALAVALRAYRPGAVTTMVVVTVVGLLVVLVPLALAVGTLGRQLLPAQVAVPFVVCAVGLVAVAALFPESSADARWVPLFDLLSFHPRGVIRMGPVGFVLAAGYVVAVGWTAVVVALSRSRPAGEPQG